MTNDHFSQHYNFLKIKGPSGTQINKSKTQTKHIYMYILYTYTSILYHHHHHVLTYTIHATKSKQRVYNLSRPSVH